MRFSALSRSIFLICIITIIQASIDEPIRICAIRVSFLEDDLNSTSGNGKFLLESEGIDCSSYTIDPPPHDREYFESQLVAVHSYFDAVSYGQFGINLEHSNVYPTDLNNDYQLDQYMNYYNPYNNYELQEKRLTELFRDALVKAYSEDQIQFSDYDIIVIFHSGIGQDFSLPFLDPTPEDIPSTYVDQNMLQNHLGEPHISINGHFIEHGILLPESQNHLLFDISESIFLDAENPCDYQYGLTGTFALMLGFAIGLPPLWNINTGESGVGIFGLMDQGSNNGHGIVPAPPTAWSRIYAGWETPFIYGYGSQVWLPERNENQIIKVPIRSNEYFLIENRNNNVQSGISIDSIRYLMGQTQADGSYPSFIEILYDSSGIQKDNNGVVTYVPNYDIALPASGLLIWHIDENIIYSGIDAYTINSDLSNRGIDLEEADGAQDIGYVSIHFFNDPSSGYFGDMWYKGNTQYNLANPSLVDLKPQFGYYTNPSTNANDGSSTFISIDEISIAKDTMTFRINNAHIVNGFPDTTFQFRFLFDIDNDGDNDLIGGKDSLYISITDTTINRNYFYDTQTQDLIVSFTKQNDHTIIDIVEYFQDSCLHSRYDYFIPSGEIILLYDVWIDSLIYPISNYDHTSIDWKTKNQWESHTKRVYALPYNYGIDINTNGITVDRFGGPETKWKTKKFCYLTGIDLDLDSKTDLLALDTSGILYAFNSELILMPGFPLNIQLAPPILSQNIFNTIHPEIIAKSYDNRSLYIFNNKGNIQFQFVMEDDDLIAISDYQGKNSIFTESSIYQFDETSDLKGNFWNFEHGNIGHSRSIDLNYTFKPTSDSMLTRCYVYPNPIRETVGTIRVETIGSRNIIVNIYDLAGYFIRSFNLDLTQEGNQIEEWVWNVNEIESGLYFVHVSASNGKKIETQIIKVAVIN